MNDAGIPQISLRKLATVLGVSQPFLSQIRAGKRPLPEALKQKVEALGAYHLLISDKQDRSSTGDEGAGLEKEYATSGTTIIGGTDWVRTVGLALMKRLD